MKPLHFHINNVLKHNQDGSFSTQATRAESLHRSATQLLNLGFKVVHTKYLKPKHIHVLTEHWLNAGLSAGTIKNRMSHLRWLSEKIENTGLVKRDNAQYGIPDRKHVNGDKSSYFRQSQIDSIPSNYIRVSAELQSHFGLRREEAMKFIVSYADKGSHIVLKPSWTKGGRGREIPITTDGQRRALSLAHNVAGQGSLIPQKQSYYSHSRVFEKQMSGVGLGRTHGARHAYAQRRYTEITNLLPAAKGGKPRRELNQFDREVDTHARSIISVELGHERIEIVAVYLGG